MLKAEVRRCREQYGMTDEEIERWKDGSVCSTCGPELIRLKGESDREH